ncbi:ROK family protein [Streptomyces sp. 130]|uniref:ROK family protein n=1 Tax=Streptomyces sp. 130 TaxID=2591006 RepID=UPI00118037E0|nr:ROK family protein [Streptomyces sp. 130]TRV80982.1 ROK family protein [Streptomyces sp. 130]
MSRVPVLEIGGTHVTAAVLDTASARPAAQAVVRRPVPADAPAGELLDAIAAVGAQVDAPAGAHWGVAIPGPFDYETGVGRFRGIGKFESLHGVDVGAGLLVRLPGAPRRISFVNDADAFALGEYRAGAAAGRRRVLCVTLGTGVGTSFLDDGRPVLGGPDVPPGGRAHRLTIDGLPLEEVVSRRAIRRLYASTAALPGDGDLPDVHEIAAAARGGDGPALHTLRYCFGALGRALAPWCERFRPDLMVVGGSMTGSWDLLGPAVREGIASGGPGTAPPAVTAQRPADAPLIGAAHWTLRAPAVALRERT